MARSLWDCARAQTDEGEPGGQRPAFGLGHVDAVANLAEHDPSKPALAPDPVFQRVCGLGRRQRALLRDETVGPGGKSILPFVLGASIKAPYCTFFV